MRSVQDFGNRAEYARGAGQLSEVLNGDYELHKPETGSYEKEYKEK